MPAFSTFSLEQLKTLEPRLQAILVQTINHYDFKILEGFRGEQAQNAAWLRGASKLRWPYGKHNKQPSLAVDVAPWPVDWSNAEAARQRFCFLAGFIMHEAIVQGVKLRWGGDWDGDMDTRDEKFRDLGHFELID